MLKPLLRLAALILSLILYAATIFSAYGGRFNTDLFTFPAVMTLALPYLSAATLIVAIAWLCGGRIVAGALGILSLVASWGSVSTVWPMHSSRKATPGAQTFTFMTFNMRHGWDREEEHPDTAGNRVIEFIINSGIDIVNVQEFNWIDSTESPGLTDSQKQRLHEAYPFYVGDPTNDMKVFSKYPAIFENGYNYVEGDFDKKRYSFFKLNINGRKLTLINVHLLSFKLTGKECEELSDINSVGSLKTGLSVFKGPVYRKLEQGFKTRKKDAGILRRTIDRMKGPMIVSGDFNDVPESYTYRLVKGDDMKDAYVETGFGPMITFNAHAMWFHLDQILYRGDLRPLYVKKVARKLSDHYPVISEFEFTEN